MESEELFWVEHECKTVGLPADFKIKRFKGLRELWIKPAIASSGPANEAATGAVVSVWKNKELYELYGGDLRDALNAGGEISATTVSRAQHGSRRVFSLKVAYAVLTTLVAIIGALVALRGYFDYFWEYPSIGIYREAPSPEGSIPALFLTNGKSQVLVWRVLNHGRTQPVRITQIEPRLSSPNTNVILRRLSADHIPKLAVGDEKMISVMVDSKATEPIVLSIQLKAEAGVSITAAKFVRNR